MVSRQSLKDKAVSAGKSVAGTLSGGVSELKRRAKTVARDDESGIEISEVQGQYLVIDADGDAVGPYDTRKEAAAKAREMKRDQGTSEVAGQTQATQTTSTSQQLATRFSQGVNSKARAAAEKAADAGENLAEPTEEPAGGGPSLFGPTDSDDESGPQLPMMTEYGGGFADDGDGGGDDTQPGVAAAFDLGPGPDAAKDNQPGFGFFEGSDDAEPTIPFFEQDEGDDSTAENTQPWWF